VIFLSYVIYRTAGAKAMRPALDGTASAGRKPAQRWEWRSPTTLSRIKKEGWVLHAIPLITFEIICNLMNQRSFKLVDPSLGL